MSKDVFGNDIFKRQATGFVKAGDQPFITITSNGTAGDTVVKTADGGTIGGITKIEITIDAETNSTIAVLTVLSPTIVLENCQAMVLEDANPLKHDILHYEKAQSLIERAVALQEKLT